MFPQNPCVSCGACCAHFRVSFFWAEADSEQDGCIPSDLVEDLPPYRVCMKGTNQAHPRCVALQGEIGRQATCTIYEQRPSPCREFGLQWEQDQASFAPGELERCNRARAAWNLPPLVSN